MAEVTNRIRRSRDVKLAWVTQSGEHFFAPVHDDDLADVAESLLDLLRFTANEFLMNLDEDDSGLSSPLQALFDVLDALLQPDSFEYDEDIEVSAARLLAYLENMKPQTVAVLRELA